MWPRSGQSKCRIPGSCVWTKDRSHDPSKVHQSSFQGCYMNSGRKKIPSLVWIICIYQWLCSLHSRKALSETEDNEANVSKEETDNEKERGGERLIEAQKNWVLGPTLWLACSVFSTLDHCSILPDRYHQCLWAPTIPYLPKTLKSLPQQSTLEIYRSRCSLVISLGHSTASHRFSPHIFPKCSPFHPSVRFSPLGETAVHPGSQSKSGK